MTLSQKLFGFFVSLKTAVIVILLLALALAIGTIVESIYDIQTGRYWVYRSWWFAVLLTFLGWIILLVALSRRPWKRRHIPFLIAHLGILILLSGSAVTQIYGLDGNLILGENESSAQVRLDRYLIHVDDRLGQVESMEIPWIPPHVKFKPMTLARSGVRVINYLTHAEEKVDLKETDEGPPAVLLHLKGGPIQITQPLWLFAGSAETSMKMMGPAQFLLLGPESKISDSLADTNLAGTRASLTIRMKSDGSIHVKAFSSKGKTLEKNFARGMAEGEVLDPGWMPAFKNMPTGSLKITFQKVIEKAQDVSRYGPYRVQFGNDAPESAIQIEIPGDQGGPVWLGLGDQKDFETSNGKLRVRYFPQMKILPFSLLLDRFSIVKDPGSESPASYSSTVRVVGEGSDSKPSIISMNEPLDWGGFTFYQSSFIPGEPRPTVTILSVNWDPGRWIKYIGSLLIVAGATLLFMVKYFKIRWLS